jgi:site-specific DNA recombinase
MRTESGGYRRDHLRALAQRVEVDSKEVRIMGSKSELLRTLVVASGAKTAGFSVPSLYRSGAPRPMKMGTIVSP